MTRWLLGAGLLVAVSASAQPSTLHTPLRPQAPAPPGVSPPAAPAPTRVAPAPVPKPVVKYVDRPVIKEVVKEVEVVKTVEVPQGSSWRLGLAALLNAVGTMGIIKLAAHSRLLPVLRERYPAVLPVLAGLIGPALAWVQNFLTQYLGAAVAFDIPMVLAAFTGASAIALAQVQIQLARSKTPTLVKKAVAPKKLALEGRPI